MGHWDKYWQEGHLTSFSEDYDTNYDDDIASFWVGCFKELQAGSSILDLATGNLALPFLAYESGTELDVFAIDLSKIDKDIIAAKNSNLRSHLDKVNLSDETNIENLPYDDEQFDLITSNFGFEYSNLNLSIPEVSRVLKAGGDFVAAYHSDDSLIVSKNRNTISFIEHVLKRSKFFDIFEKLNKSIGTVESNRDIQKIQANNRTEQLRMKLNQCLGTLEGQYKTELWESGMIDLVKVFFNNLIGSNTKLRSNLLLKQRLNYLEHIKRLKDLDSAVIGRKRQLELEVIMNDVGMEIIEVKPLLRNGLTVGKTLKATKSGV